MATANQLSQLYVSLFNRAVDSGVVSTYSNQAYGTGLMTNIITDGDLNKLSTSDFVKLLYKNALNKDMNSDANGINFWINTSNTNNWSKAQLLSAFLDEVDLYVNDRKTNPTETDKAGVQVFRAKIGISDDAATKVSSNTPVTELTFGQGLPNVTAANANQSYADALSTLSSLAIRYPNTTSGGNTITLDSGGSVEVGSGATSATKADDTINATVAQTGSTLTSSSKIDGGDGFDTLNVNMTANFGPLGNNGAITNIEKIALTNAATNSNNAPFSFDASGIKGVSTYVLSGANGINLSNIEYTNALLIALNGVKNQAGTNLNFTGTLAGQKLALDLTDVGYDSTDATNGNHAINVGPGIGAINMTVSGTNYADIIDQGVNKITVGGSGSLKTNLSAGVNYFNGGSNQGGLDITVADPYAATTNGSNVFTHFSTGAGEDKVSINVSRLDNNTIIDLGDGLNQDTLTLTGATRDNNATLYYNLNTIEHLVLNTDASSTLNLDLGTKVSTGETTDPDDTTTSTSTQDRSASLKTVTVENGANVQLTSLGAKSLGITYKGTSDAQSVLLDHSGVTNLRVEGSGNSGAAGFINLSESQEVNLDVKGQGFNGYLNFGKAQKLTIDNTTKDQALVLKANTATDKNNLSAVQTLDIKTNAQGVNVVDLSATNDMTSLSALSLDGNGNVSFGNIANRDGSLTITGSSFAGKLTSGNIDTRNGTLSLVSKGSIQTGEITGSNITIDLEKAGKDTTNDIGLITIKQGSATTGSGGNTGTSSNGSLVYKAGQNGTIGTDGNNTPQEIYVEAASASINLQGGDGVERFNITADSKTKTLSVSGDLGSIAAGNPADGLSIDLSRTNGATLDTSNLRIATTDAQTSTLTIIGSKGTDNITLGSSGAGTDVVAFKAGGQTNQQQEVLTFDLGSNPKLSAVGQYIEVAGLRATVSDITPTAASAGVSAGVITTALSNILKQIQNGTKETAFAFTSAGAMTQASATGSSAPAFTLNINSVTSFLKDADANFNLNNWTVTNTGTTLTLTHSSNGDYSGFIATELSKLTITGNARVDAYTAPQANVVDGNEAIPTNTTFAPAANTANTTDSFLGFIAPDGNVYNIAYQASTKLSASNAATVVSAVLEGKALPSATSVFTGLKVQVTKNDGASASYQAGTDLTGAATFSASGGNIVLGGDSGTNAFTFKASAFTLAGEGQTKLSAATGTGATSAVTVAVSGTDGGTKEIKLTIGTNSVSAATIAQTVAAVLNGDALPTGTKITQVSIGTAAYAPGTDLISGYTARGSASNLVLKPDNFRDATAFKLTVTQGAATPQTITTTAADFTGTTLVGQDIPAAAATVSFSFTDMKADQSITLEGKTLTALTDLKADAVAKAFAGTTDSGTGYSFGGTTFDSQATDGTDLGNGYTFAANGSTLVATYNTTGALGISATDFSMSSNKAVGEVLTGGNKVSVTDGTTGNSYRSESYVNITGSIGDAAASAAPTVASLTLNSNAMDTITNFETNTDKLQLSKFKDGVTYTEKFSGSDAVGKQANGTYSDNDANAALNYSGATTIPTTSDVSVTVSNGNISTNIVAGGTAGAVQYVGGSLQDGVISFYAVDATGARVTTNAATISLEQKFKALSEISANKIVAFEDGSDTYIVAGGNNGATTEDDLAIKLAGVSGLTDIGTILA